MVHYAWSEGIVVVKVGRPHDKIGVSIHRVESASRIFADWLSGAVADMSVYDPQILGTDHRPINGEDERPPRIPNS